MKKPSRLERDLIASAKEALAIKRGEIAPAKSYYLPLTKRQAVAEAAPEFSAAAVARIRDDLRLSQPVFAAALNVSPATVRAWEQGQNPPSGPAARLLEIARERPEVIRRFVKETSGSDAAYRTDRTSGAKSTREREGQRAAAKSQPSARKRRASRP